MKKSHRNTGIQIENNIRVSTEVDSKNIAFQVIAQAFFILIAVIGIIYSWIEGFSLDVDHKLFITGLVITVLVHVGLNEIRRYQVYFFLSYFLIIGGLTYHYWDYVVNGFYCLENAVIEKVAFYYDLNPVRFVVFLDEDKSTTAIMILVLQVLTLVVGLEVYKHYMRSVYLFFILFFYGGLLAVGVTPPATFMILVLLSYVSFGTMDRIPGAYHKLGIFQRQNYHELSQNGKQKLRTKAALVMIVCLLVSLLIVRLAVTKEYYDEHIDLTQTKVKIQTAIKDFSVAKTLNDVKKSWNEINPFTGDKKMQSGGLNSGKLGGVKEVEFTGEVALEVTLDEDVTFLYLKGYAGGQYSFDEWLNLSDKDNDYYEKIVDRYGEGTHIAETLLWEWFTHEKYDAALVNDSGISVVEGDVTVDYVNANQKFLYAPYSSNYRLGDMRTVGDLYIVSGEERSSYLFTDSYLPYNLYSDLNQMFYDVNYRLYADDIYPSWEYESFTRFESAYRDFVYNAYTKLPSSGLERLRAVSFDDSGTGIQRTVNLVSQVIYYLDTNTDYSLSPGVPKEGEDFAEYFLFDKKQGYCSHYATAAVLLLRNYGVPARYIEGYVVTGQEIKEADTIRGRKTVEVRDYNAHAWVEVYMDGVGWVPVEVTKGYSYDGVSNLQPEINQSLGGSPTEKPTATVTVTPSVSPTSKPQVTKQPTVMPTNPPEGKASGQKTNNSSTMWSSLVLLTLACIMFIIVFFVVHYHYKRRTRIRKLTKSPPNHQGIYSFEQIINLLEMKGITKLETMSFIEFAQNAMQVCYLLPPQFDEIVELTLKAKFAKDGITAIEAKKIYDYYNEFQALVYQSESKGKRFILKYWKGF